MEERESFPPSLCPASMGPPEINAAGTFTRTAPRSMPGIILSQLPMRTMASKACAFARISTLSAIISREGREYFMPSWPIAMPSHTPMQGTVTGFPPAASTPSETARASSSRCVCPGMMSLCAEMTPTMGFCISESVQPSARKSERCAAILAPFEKMLIILFPYSRFRRRCTCCRGRWRSRPCGQVP